MHSPHPATELHQPALSAPQLRKLLAELRTLDKVGDCEGLKPEPGKAPQLDLEALSADAMLVSTECWRGACNTGSAY